MSTWTRRVVALVFGTSLLASTASSVAAQELPARPISIGDRLTIGAEMSATFGCGFHDDTEPCDDDLGFFNYTDYEHSTLRMLRVGLTATLKATNHLTVLGELRSENGDAPQPYALYLNVRPWLTRSFDVQIGRVPPAFGAFRQRPYLTGNLLIGYPLGYQYLTSLREDALPANADELLRMRGRGWLSSYSVGNPTPEAGLPLAAAFTWDTGVRMHAASHRFDAAAAVTTGTQANPLVGDDNAGRQISGRLAVLPFTGLVVGGSLARGPFTSRDALEKAGHDPDDDSFTQTVWGSDVEYSRDYYLVRFESVVSRWRLPVIGSPTPAMPLETAAISVEGRYRLSPGLYVAGRWDRLTFSSIAGTARVDSWDAPVRRAELGVGYSLQRNLLLKASVQTNRRPAGRVRDMTFLAGQLLYWF